MEVNSFQILQNNQKCNKRIWTSPAVKGLKLLSWKVGDRGFIPELKHSGLEVLKVTVTLSMFWQIHQVMTLGTELYLQSSTQITSLTKHNTGHHTVTNYYPEPS